MGLNHSTTSLPMVSDRLGQPPSLLTQILLAFLFPFYLSVRTC